MFKKILSGLLSVCLVLGAVLFMPRLHSHAAPAVLAQDFENYECAAGGATKNRLSNYVLYTTSGDNGQAHSGTKSLYRSAAANTYRVAVFPEATTAPLQAGNTYELRFWLKIAAAIPGTGTIQLMYSGDKSNANAQIAGSSTPNICILKKPNETSTNVDTGKVGEWQEIVYTFTATHTGYLNLSGWGTNEYYLDDISLKCAEETDTAISFQSNGGGELSQLKGVAGAELPALPIPTRAGKMFNGWYTDAELTHVFTGTTFPESPITLYAGWVEEGQYQQGFEGYVINGALASNTLSVYTKQSDRDPLVHTGQKSLYKPATNSSYFLSVYPYATQKLIKGKGYRLNLWVYVPQQIDRDHEGALRLTLLDTQTNAFSSGDKPQMNIQYFNGNFKAGQWQQLSLIFTAEADGYAGIYAYGATELYIDDISLAALDTVTVTFDTCGGNPLAKQVGAVGQTVATVPTPTHPKGLAFAGWFTDRAYTGRFSFTKFPQADLTLYAKWIEKGAFEQTFEGYYYENGGSNTAYSKEVFSVYHAAGPGDPYVRNGKTSMRYCQSLNSAVKSYSLSIFDPTMGELEIGEKYYVSYWMKFKDITNTFYHAVYNNAVVDNPGANYFSKGYFTVHKNIIGKTGNVEEYCYGPGGKFRVSEPDENGWIQFTFETTATDKYFSLFMDWYAEVYIDDITITPLPSGVVEENYSKPFCEPLYDEIADQHPGALNKSAPAPQIYELKLQKRGDYVFSAALTTANPNGWLALAWDAKGKQIIPGTQVTAGNTVCARLVLGKLDSIYLVVYNPVGNGMVSRATLCRTLSAKESLSVQNGDYVRFSESQLPELQALMREGQYAEVLRDAVFEVTDEAGTHFAENSPATGSALALLPLWLLPGALGALCACRPKRRKCK